jgi:ribosome-associated protein
MVATGQSGEGAFYGKCGLRSPWKVHAGGPARGTIGGMRDLTPMIAIPESEIEITAVRAQGAGGQNVNKVSNAVHLRFDIRASSLPGFVKQRLLDSRDQRISRDGMLVLKAQQHRSLERNRVEAIERLHDLVARAAVVLPKRRPTRPSRSAKRKRLESKTKRGEVKKLRGRVIPHHDL